MLEAHKDLLAQIELAEEAARTLYAKGANVELAIRGLRQAGGLIKDRVAQYIRDAKKPQKGQKPVAGDQTPASEQKPVTGDQRPASDQKPASDPVVSDQKSK